MPEAGGGGSLFNLRAWGAGVVSGLKLGQGEGLRGGLTEPDEDESAALPAPVPAPDAGSSWDEWQQYFRDIDDALERTEEVHVAMEAAVAGEQYSEAARLRSSLAELEARDSVGGVLRVSLCRNQSPKLSLSWEHGLCACWQRCGSWRARDSAGSLLQVHREPVLRSAAGLGASLWRPGQAGGAGLCGSVGSA